MIVSVLVCLVSFAVLFALLRRDRASVGLPIAYLFGLLLIHVPGALAHTFGAATLLDSELTETGVFFTAIGSVAFLAGVWLAHFRPQVIPATAPESTRDFQWFCIAGGLVFTLAFTLMVRVPTLSAALDRGGTIWMLGVLLGLQDSLRRHDVRWTLIWMLILAVYPVLMLLFGGFVSYGSTAISIVLAGLAVSVRSNWRIALGTVIVAVLGVNIFVNYFQWRTEIRDAVWGGAPMETRIDVTAEVVRNFEWLDPGNDAQMKALDQRLNQNYFAGLAAQRIDEGHVEYLYGRSVWEGVLSLVPRILWPEKPVFGGSPQIVSEMTGLTLNEETAWGVGNVMEFHINFGIAGLMGGFVILGALLGHLDRNTAVAVAIGNYGKAAVCFLPAVALTNPIGSLVELSGGAGAALAAGWGWKWVWDRRALRRARHQRIRGFR